MAKKPKLFTDSMFKQMTPVNQGVVHPLTHAKKMSTYHAVKTYGVRKTNGKYTQKGSF